MPDRLTWQWVGDRALLRDFDGGELVAMNQAAREVHGRLVAACLAEVEDVVPAARSVLVVLREGYEPSRSLLDALEISPSAGDLPSGRLHEIDVAYGGDEGPDLDEVARHAGLSSREAVRLHGLATYTVGFLGFSPGFAYLIGLPARLAIPRLATPRTRVAAGSVAIAGEFSGVYPRATPGGWRLIGRADVALFDPTIEPPARLMPGDSVRFVPR